MFGLFRNKARDPRISQIYDQILAQARLPQFYLEGRVPDTVEGRIDMMLLHLFLVMHRLRDEDDDTLKLAGGVCDMFFAELDRAMREIGVGDLSVPKKMRKVADIYVGCSTTYGNALADSDRSQLQNALLRNVYAGSADRQAEAEALAAYVRDTTTALREMPVTRLLSGALPFSAPAFTVTGIKI